jgi:phospholipase D1/2
MEREHSKADKAEGVPSRPMSPQDEDQSYFSPKSAVSENISPGGMADAVRRGLDTVFDNKIREQNAKELREELLQRHEGLASFNHDVDWEQAGNPNLKANRKLTEDHRITKNDTHKQDVEGHGFDHMAETDERGYGIGRDTTVVEADKEVLIAELDTEGHKPLTSPRSQGQPARLPSYVMRMEAPNPPMPPRPGAVRMNTEALGLPMLSQLPALPVEDDTDIGGPALEKPTSRDSVHHSHPLVNEIRRPLLDRDCMQDPIHDAFMDDTWHVVAENNTKIYRTVFRCMPDNLVRDWHEYHQYIAYEQRFNHLQGTDVDAKVPPPTTTSRTGPPGAGTGPASTAAANIGIRKSATDMSAKGAEMRDSLKKKLHAGDIAAEVALKEKEELRAWAREQNEKQAERQGKTLQRRDTLPEQHDYDEKSGGLPTVPEDDHRLPTGSSESNGSANDEKTSTGDTAVASLDGVGARDNDASAPAPTLLRSVTSADKERHAPFPASDSLNHNVSVGLGHGVANSGSVHSSANGTQRRRRRATTRGSRREFSASDDILSVEEAEELLNCVQGHLVAWPYDWYVCACLRLAFGVVLLTYWCDIGLRRLRRAVIGSSALIRSVRSKFSKF